MTAERTYAAEDITAMRISCDNLAVAGLMRLHFFREEPDEGRRAAVRAQYSESILQTYIMAGVSPEEVEVVSRETGLIDQ